MVLWTDRRRKWEKMNGGKVPERKNTNSKKLRGAEEKDEVEIEEEEIAKENI